MERERIDGYMGVEQSLFTAIEAKYLAEIGRVLINYDIPNPD